MYKQRSLNTGACIEAWRHDHVFGDACLRLANFRKGELVDDSVMSVGGDVKLSIM